MARTRNYQAEYLARQERARSKEFRGYYHERQERQRLQEANLRRPREFHPITPWDRRHGAPGMQGPSGPSPDTDPTTGLPDWDYYWPTDTTDETRPATRQARYSARHEQMEVIFRDGTPWTYTGISEEFWFQFKYQTNSPGSLIYSIWPPYSYLDQEVTNQHPGGWGNVQGTTEWSGWRV